MIETGNESQLSAQLLLLSSVATVVGCTEVLFQPTFSYVLFNMSSAEHETYNALVAVWCGRHRARSVSRDLTRHSLNAHS